MEAVFPRRLIGKLNGTFKTKETSRKSDTPLACSTKYGGSCLSALRSPTHVANVIATKNTVFHARQCSGQEAMGSKAFNNSLCSTSDRSQFGTGCASIRYDLSKPLMNCFVNGWVKTK